MKSAGKARSNGLYRHIRTSKEIIRNLLNYSRNYIRNVFIRFGTFINNMGNIFNYDLGFTIKCFIY